MATKVKLIADNVITTDQLDLTSISTTNISEGTNLYYTDTRVDSRLSSGSVATISTSGDVTVGGNLTVNGSTTTINSTTLTVDDLNIVLASGAADAASANGAGITIDGASASLTYYSSPDAFSFNKNVGIGTSSPQSFAKLQVNTATDRNAAFFDNAAGATLCGITDAGASTSLRLAGFPLIFTGNGGSGAEHMRIDSSGNVGIGTTSPSVKLEVSDNIAITGGSDRRITLGSSGTIGANDSNHLRADGTSLKFNSAGGEHIFEQNGSEAMRIDSSQNLLVGTTTIRPDNGTGNTGIQLDPAGVLRAGRAGDCMILNRQSTDGAIVYLRKDGTDVGSIGAFGGSLFVSGANSGVFFNGNGMEPTSGGSTRVDNTENIGSASWRFKDLYLSGGVYLGGTGAANLLDDYEEGTWTPTPISLTTSGTVTYTGTYTKIGRFVFGLLTVSSSGGTTTATADITRFSGLPFTSDTIGGMALSINTATSGSTAAGQIGGGATTLVTGGWSAAVVIRMSFWYTTT